MLANADKPHSWRVDGNSISTFSIVDGVRLVLRNSMGRVALGFPAILLAGLMTGYRVLPVLFEWSISRQVSDILVAFSGGVKPGIIRH
jgi:hypothetical protein